MKNLSEKAILVNLSISLWSATKLDKKVTREVEKNHNAKDAGRFNKILIAKKNPHVTEHTKDKEDSYGIQELTRISATARAYHYEQTLPWGDNGDRLLPSTNYFEYINQQRTLKQQFETAIEKFIMNYPDLKADAKIRLGDMYNESDYPPIARLKKKFSMEMSFMPIAKLDDFRLSVDQSEVDNLRSEIEQSVYKRINEATKDLWLRIKEAVKHMYEKLADKDAIFRDSLVHNISDLIELLPRLNFTNDDDINTTIREMKKLVVAPESLRTNGLQRNETASNAKEILNKINDFFFDDSLQEEDAHLAAA